MNLEMGYKKVLIFYATSCQYFKEDQFWIIEWFSINLSHLSHLMFLREIKIEIKIDMEVEVEMKQSDVKSKKGGFAPL